MVVLGIDPHLTRVAVAAISIDGDLLFTAEAPLPKTEDWREWIAAVREFVRLAVVKCEDNEGRRPVCAVVERGDWAGRNVRVALRHAESVGATAAEMVRAAPDALVELIGPRRWRQLAGVQGGGKVAVREFVEARFPEMAGERSQDQIDAVAIAIAGLALIERVDTETVADPDTGGTTSAGGGTNEEK